MLNLVNIAITALFAQNILLVIPVSFGCNPRIFLRAKEALLTGLSLTLALMILSPLSRWLDLLLLSFDLSLFLLLGQALLATVGSYFLGCVIEKCSPDLWVHLGDSLRSLPSQGGILTVFLLAQQQNYTALEAFVFGLFAGVGVLISLVSLVGIRQSQDQKVQVLQGLSMFFITAGLMSLSLVGFYGLYLS